MYMAFVQLCISVSEVHMQFTLLARSPLIHNHMCTCNIQLIGTGMMIYIGVLINVLSTMVTDII